VISKILVTSYIVVTLEIVVNYSTVECDNIFIDIVGDRL